VKTILAAALILALGITGLFLLGAVHGQRMSVSSSQIYVDGTPVCVLRHGRDIIASVGMCDTPGGESADDGFGKDGVFNRGRRITKIVISASRRDTRRSGFPRIRGRAQDPHLRDIIFPVYPRAPQGEVS